MANIGEILIKISAKDEGSKVLASIGKSTEKLGSQLRDAGKAMMGVGTAIVSGMGAMALSYAEAGHQIELMSIKTGFGAEALSELKYAMELTGSSFDSLQTASRGMANALVMATEAGDKAVTPFTQLNLNIKELRDMKPEQQFDTIANALKGVEDKTLQVALAQDIFGRSALEILPYITAEKDEVTDLKEQAHELNLVYTEEGAKAAGAVADQAESVKKSFDGIKNAIAVAVMPALTDFLTKTAEIVARIKDWVALNPDLVNTVLKVGAVLIGAGGLLFALGSISKAIIGINTALAIMQGLSGPKGWVTLGAGIAAAGVAIVAMNKMIGSVETSSRKNEIAKLESDYGAGKITFDEYMERITALLPAPPKGYASGGTVPGTLGAPVPIIAHGGERFLGSGSSGGSGLTINNPVFMGDEVSMRSFARKIKQLIGEDDRRNAFGQVNKGYYYGRSAV
jgi:uncharacterized metal-binding protein